MTSQLAASVVTTLPNHAWDTYGRKMLTSMAANWPAEIALLVVLDDDKLLKDVEAMIRPQDACVVFNSKERTEFLERNKGRDDPNDYRKQASRFCHKVFALKFAADFWKASKEEGKARYVIWLDADVLITRPVSTTDVQACLPKQGDAVSYLGRKDWPHSECGWLAFDLENGGEKIIDLMHYAYTSDNVFQMEQWHDSWVFDHVSCHAQTRTNLTPDKPGMEIWPHSPMAAWSKHYKGPIAKEELATGIRPQQQPSMKQPGGMNLQIQTKNSLPNEVIQRNILENQAQIPANRWIKQCKPTDEELVVVSAGPMLMAENLHAEVKAGRRIVAVKHALEPLKEAGIKPWACILLDPREHVYKFVENPDRDILWFVSSQVTPKAVKRLLDSGCEVWGYHAAVGAEEHVYTEKQKSAIVSGGSATATRGLFMLDRLGFRNFRLYGYDLCIPDKPNLNEKDEIGQPKYFEVMLDATTPHYSAKRGFWSKGELLAQYQEFSQIMQLNLWKIKAFGHGVVPFMVEAKEVSDLREKAKKAKMDAQRRNDMKGATDYRTLLGCRNKTPLWALLPRMLRKTRRKPTKASSF